MHYQSIFAIVQSLEIAFSMPSAPDVKSTPADAFLLFLHVTATVNHRVHACLNVHCMSAAGRVGAVRLPTVASPVGSELRSLETAFKRTLYGMSCLSCETSVGIADLGEELCLVHSMSPAWNARNGTVSQPEFSLSFMSPVNRIDFT